MKYILASLLMLFALSSQAQEFSRTTLFHAGMDGYHTFRIPAIIQSRKGTLIAFAEARRYGGGDSGDIDLVARRSEDGGKTWGEMIMVWDDGQNTCGNPAPVVDRASGRIILPMTWNSGKDKEHEIVKRTSQESRRVFVCHSDDDGLTWSNPTEITSQTKLSSWTWYATGPCHAIQLWSKPHRGRLVIPCDHGNFTGNGSDDYSHIIYSDDCGDTWHIGGVMQGGNESTIVERKDGSLMLNARWQRGKTKGARHYSISEDGGESLGEVMRDEQLPEPACQASIIGYSHKGKPTDHLLFVNPASSTRRENLTLRQSFDGGESWDEGIVIEPGNTAYSDLVVTRNGDVGILFETGEKSPYEKIVFVVIPKKIL
ncbi:MAG: exo-alpha-sialidase [Alistipes sp.]|nr:exo-alpha-sialidase [Alistipes sp.]